MTARVCAGDRGFDASRVDVEVVVADIDEHGARARLQDDVRRRGEGERGDDDFVVGRAAGHRADAVGEQGEVEGGGAAVHGDGVLCADVVGERLLEGGDARALGQLSRREGFGDGAEFVFFDQGLGEFDHGGAFRRRKWHRRLIDEDSSLRSE